jgi:enamine deaminase RidA (YjgF/YER057c/UK114 family)
MQTKIQRSCSSPRYADWVVHHGVARWVEVADDCQTDLDGQVAQILAQIDRTLERLGSERKDLLQVLIFLADLSQVQVLNAAWDEWVDRQHPPVRACVGASLQSQILAEFVVCAAVEPDR